MKAERLYLRRFWVAIAIYVILVIVTSSVLDSLEDGTLRVVVSLLPMIPIVFGMWAFMQFIRQIDELQRRIHFEAFAFSLGCTGLITFTVGFLGNAGIPQFGLIWVFPMIIAFWGIGVAIAGRRYR
jgi:hypothetical protein